MATLPLPSLPSTSPKDASEAATEAFLLALLSDSNLPTGGFVASSGLEAWIQHGYLSLAAPPLPSASDTTAASNSSSAADQSAPLLAFVSNSLHSYAKVNAPLLRAAHAAVWSLSHPSPAPSSSASPSSSVESALSAILATDQLCESLTLNHVARRASVTQGAAFLALYERAFAPPSGAGEGQEKVREVVKRLREQVRRTAAGREEGEAGEGRAYGHMTVSYAVLTAAVGLRIGAALPLLLFLHARSLLSSAVRLNTIGPYLAHRMLLWDVRPLVDRAVEAVAVSPARAGYGESKEDSEHRESDVQKRQEGDWWDDDPFWQSIWDDDPLSPHPPLTLRTSSTSSSTRPKPSAIRPEDSLSTAWPVTTWPVGEIIATRHDQLFTKVFNS
ncbi:hypothetical protein JCM11251_004232 [Rhodosporidiobolus azoricus]